MVEKKEDLPAMPQYWGDWFKAMDLMSLPRDVRCVWFEMLGRMWESNERGYLTISGKPLSDFALANILGFGEDVPSYKKYEKTLEDAGIFSRRKSDGAIYSRKMVRLIELSKKRSEAGALGAQKTWGFAKAKEIATARANGMANTETETEDVNTDTNTNTGEKKKSAERKKREVFVAPVCSEVEAFFVAKGFTADLGKRAWEYYDTAKWRDSHGKQVLNWKQKVIANWMKDEDKISEGGNGMLSKAGQRSMANAKIVIDQINREEEEKNKRI